MHFPILTEGVNTGHPVLLICEGYESTNPGPNFILGPTCEGPKCDLFARLFFWSSVPQLKISVKSWLLSLYQEIEQRFDYGNKSF